MAQTTATLSPLDMCDHVCHCGKRFGATKTWHTVLVVHVLFPRGQYSEVIGHFRDIHLLQSICIARELLADPACVVSLLGMKLK